MVPTLVLQCYILLTLTTPPTEAGFAQLNEAVNEYRIWDERGRPVSVGPWDRFDEVLKRLNLRATKRLCPGGG